MVGAKLLCTSSLFDVSLQGLENLFKKKSAFSRSDDPIVNTGPYLKLNLSLSDVSLAATAAGNLLGLSNLGTDGLGGKYQLAWVVMSR